MTWATECALDPTIGTAVSLTISGDWSENVFEIRDRLPTLHVASVVKYLNIQIYKCYLNTVTCI